MTIKNNKETTKVSFFLRKFIIVPRNMMNWNRIVQKIRIFILIFMSSYERI